MKIKPIGSRMLVRPDGADSETGSGIMLRATDKDLQQWGTVVSIGPEVREVNPGDRILFEKFAGSPVEVESAAHLIMDESDVIGVQINMDDLL